MLVVSATGELAYSGIGSRVPWSRSPRLGWAPAWPVAALRIDRRRRSPRRRGAVHSRPSGKLSCQCANLTELSAVAGWVFYASGAVRLTPRGAGCPGGSAGCPVGAARAGIDLRRCRLVITSTPYVSARRQWPLGQTAGAVSAWSDGSMVCSAVRGGTSPRSMLCAVYPRYCGGTALGGVSMVRMTAL